MPPELLLALAILGAPTLALATALGLPAERQRRASLLVPATLTAGFFLVATVARAELHAALGPFGLRVEGASVTTLTVASIAFAALIGGAPRLALRGRGRVELGLAFLAITVALAAGTLATATVAFAAVAALSVAAAEAPLRRAATFQAVVALGLLGLGLGLAYGDAIPWGASLEAIAASRALGTTPSLLIVAAVWVQLGIPPFQGITTALLGTPRLGAPLLLAVAMPSLVFIEHLVGPSFGARGAEAPPVVGGLAIAAMMLSAAMVLVQRSLRRAFGLFHAGLRALVLLAALDPTPVGHVGGIVMWETTTLAATGLGLAWWAVLARRRDVDLARFAGFYADAPVLAGAFTLFGLACAGLPGTADFVSEDLSLHGAIAHHPLLLVGMIAGVSLLAFAALHLSARVFLGPRSEARLPPVRPRERRVFVALALFLLLGGLAPRALVDRVEGDAQTHARSPETASPGHRRLPPATPALALLP